MKSERIATPNDLEGRRLLTPQRAQHDEIEFQETMTAGAKRAWVSTISSLHRYHRRGLLHREKDIAQQMFQAGEEYARIAYAAGQAPLPQLGAIMRVDCSRGSPESGMDALRRLRYADQVIGWMQASCVRAVCVEDWSADAWGKAKGYARHGVGMLFLRDGLELLAKHWGMLAPKTS